MSDIKSFSLEQMFDPFGENCGLGMALEDCIDGNMGSAYTKVIECISDSFKSLPTMLPNTSLFRFSSCKEDSNNKIPILDDINKSQITLSSPDGFNDPMDPLIKAWVEYNKVHKKDKCVKKYYDLLNYVLCHTRIACFVKPKCMFSNESINLGIESCNPLMWSHYADNHKGVCVEYLFDGDFISNNSSNCILKLFDVDYNSQISVNGETSFIKSFCSKGAYWKYENETRLVCFSKQKLDSYFSITGAQIKAVYMGYRINPQIRQKLKTISNLKKIDLYQMSFNPNDISKLIAHKI